MTYKPWSRKRRLIGNCRAAGPMKMRTIVIFLMLAESTVHCENQLKGLHFKISSFYVLIYFCSILIVHLPSWSVPDSSVFDVRERTRRKFHSQGTYLWNHGLDVQWIFRIKVTSGTNVDTLISLIVSFSYEWVQVNKSEIAVHGYIQASIDQLLNGVSNKIQWLS